MEKTYHSLKDFELSYGKNAIERANDFQQYIEQLNDFGCKRLLDNFTYRYRFNNGN